MTEFTPITTQEDFDKAVQSRLEREAKKYADYETLKEKAGKYDSIAGKDYEGQIKKLTDDLKAANDKLAGHETTVKELTARAEKAEREGLKTKIALENKLPLELAGRINGDTEEAMREDAKALSKYVVNQGAAPLGSTEDSKGGDSSEAALRAFNASLGNK